MRRCVLTILLLPVLTLSLEKPTQPMTFVEVGDTRFSRYESGDSVPVNVYVENLVEAIGAVDLWLRLGSNMVVQFKTDSVWWCDTVHFNCEDSNCLEMIPDSCIEWEYFGCEDSLLCGWKQTGVLNPLGTAMEDWQIVQAFVHDSQRTVLQLIGVADTEGVVPPICPGQHLLMKFICEVSDTTGSTVDTLCNDSLLYEEYGTTVVVAEPQTQLFEENGQDLIGWRWFPLCDDSTCVEFVGDSCVEWECTEWDSVLMADSFKVYFWDGSVTLECECNDKIGDADESRCIDIDDIVYLIEYVFQGGPAPTPHFVASGDANCDCQIDIDDAVFEVYYIFAGGPPPCSCGEWGVACWPLY